MQVKTPSRETPFSPHSGYLMVAVCLLLLVGAVALITWGARAQRVSVILSGVGLFVLMVFLLPGFFVVEPNQARVLVLFGSYRGSVRTSGYWWTNPFTSKKHVSVRAHNMNSKTLKVNDLLGNPIEIATVLVWRVSDTAQASFDVEEFEHFVEVQSESAVRLIASRHPYDDLEAEGSAAETTLRGSSDVVAAELQQELQHRLVIAGIDIIEARLTHLAYAQEIAAAMLQRQQASAIIAARRLIVEGAVGMVEMALADLGKRGVVELDAERRATLVGNLLVVLCGQAAPTPVLNTGTLYT